jgi:hypothetical protein
MNLPFAFRVLMYFATTAIGRLRIALVEKQFSIQSTGGALSSDDLRTLGRPKDPIREEA